MSSEIPVTQARAEFADLVNRVVYGDERIVMTRHGKPIVALVSAADLERLEALDAGPATVTRITATPVTPSPASGRERRLDVAARHEPR